MADAVPAAAVAVSPPPDPAFIRDGDSVADDWQDYVCVEDLILDTDEAMLLIGV